MHRSLLFAFAATLCAALVLAPAATAAKTAPQTCTTMSNAVDGGKVVGTLTSSNVDPVQASFATCKWAKKVMRRTIELGVEEPRPVRSFYCRPVVGPYFAEEVAYTCTFRGADTATFIKLTFQVIYKADR
jgi:hypothetical protein